MSIIDLCRLLPWVSTVGLLSPSGLNTLGLTVGGTTLIELGRCSTKLSKKQTYSGFFINNFDRRSVTSGPSKSSQLHRGSWNFTLHGRH